MMREVVYKLINMMFSVQGDHDRQLLCGRELVLLTQSVCDLKKSIWRPPQRAILIFINST